MSEQLHTAEPWAVQRHSMAGISRVVKHNGSIEHIADVVVNANARRIVACVNFLNGIGTEKLEDKKFSFLEAVTWGDKAILAEQQRDELLAATKELIDLIYLAPEDVPNHEYETIREGALEQASKAIAKAEAA